MNFAPQKLFIGLMDFFSILLPGALLTYLLMGEVGPVVLGDRFSKLAGAEAWAAFLFASYLFGHLVFLLRSWLDEFYDWARHYGKRRILPSAPGITILPIGSFLMTLSQSRHSTSSNQQREDLKTITGSALNESCCISSLWEGKHYASYHRADFS